MFSHLSLEDFLSLAPNNSRIAVYREISCDSLTPIHAYRALKLKFEDIALLESGAQSGSSGHFSYLCFDANAEISAQGSNVHVKYQNKHIKFVGNPITSLRDYQKKLCAKIIHPLSALVGGMVGFLKFEAIHLFEPKLQSSNGFKTDHNTIDDVHFKFYRTCIAFDHRTHTAVVATLAEPITDAAQCYTAAQKTIDRIVQQLAVNLPAEENNHHRAPPHDYQQYFSVDVNDEQYQSMVHTAQKHIRSGDVFQVVLSRQFSKKINVQAFDVYRALRVLNPSPYMFFIDYGKFQILGASPEKLVSVKDNIIESCPLAGTRPITTTEPSHALEENLRNDEKEKAEHMMLVDLARNDVGAVATPGSVSVKELMQIKKFSHVMHLSSTIQGQLQPKFDVFDVLQAAFPAGTLSGAPKIRAMEIIQELETSPRNIYGGAICSIDSLGNLDSCITIRSALVKDNHISIRAGAGIVTDSHPKTEADETRHKANALLQAIAFAESQHIPLANNF